LVAVLRGHTHEVRAAAFNPEGTRIASVAHDRSLRIWDAQNGEPVLAIRAHRDWPFSVTFSPDGAWLASGAKSIRLWEATRPSAHVLEQRCARAAAADLVEQLSSRLSSSDDVIAHITRDADLADDVRDFALQIAEMTD
jgi:WD40 repeat protein